MADYPSDRKYTKDHEWAQVDGARVRVGITQHAVEALGDVTLVNIDIAVGGVIEAGKAFGTVESVKAVSDLFAPITGTIVEINDALQNKPELVNEDCNGKGWMVVIEAKDPGAVDALLDAAAYTAHVASLG